MQLRPKPHNFTLPHIQTTFLKTRSSIDVFLALLDYSSCSFASFISPLLNFWLLYYNSGGFNYSLSISICTVYYLSGHCVSFGHCVLAVRLSLLFLLKATWLDLTWRLLCEPKFNTSDRVGLFISSLLICFYLWTLNIVDIMTIFAAASMYRPSVICRWSSV